MTTVTIGMDLGDRKHQICVLDAAASKVAEVTIDNTATALRKYFSKYAGALVAMETGICEQHQLNPNVFYRWQKELFDHGTAAFERAENGAADRTGQKLQKQVSQLQAKLAGKDEVIAEIMAEQVRLKKTLGLD
jgi:hypothetical protein